MCQIQFYMPLCCKKNLHFLRKHSGTKTGFHVSTQVFSSLLSGFYANRENRWESQGFLILTTAVEYKSPASCLAGTQCSVGFIPLKISSLSWPLIRSAQLAVCIRCMVAETKNLLCSLCTPSLLQILWFSLSKSVYENFTAVWRHYR